MTMLAGAIGNGNIAGVATAIAISGPGAVFWMWVSGLFAMATKYSAAVLGLKFREQLPDGSVAGGPMYYLRNGVRSPVLAWMFAFLAGMAAMTTGPLAQTNSMALLLNTEFHIPKWLTGAGITIGTWLVVIGGIKCIARFAEKLVPLKVILYVGGSLYIIFAHIHLLPETIALILKSAFTPTAMIGGFGGASVLLAARLGAGTPASGPYCDRGYIHHYVCHLHHDRARGHDHREVDKRNREHRPGGFCFQHQDPSGWRLDGGGELVSIRLLESGRMVLLRGALLRIYLSIQCPQNLRLDLLRFDLRGRHHRGEDRMGLC